ncbi:MAG: hypothetical protein IH845_01620 [Nanoarchaeota archaeon]|nr:hypothetical protein [Nanoarchaeota archaeon]
MRSGPLFLMLLMLLILFPLVSGSPVINFSSEDILSGEPIIGTINFNETYEKEILKSNIKFYKGRRETFFEYDIKFYEGTHYFYIFANRPGDFRLEIDTQYYENGILTSKVLEKNFTIIKNNTLNNILNNILEIRPALIDINSEKTLVLRNVGNSTLNISIKDLEISLEPSKSYDYLIESTSTDPLEILEIKTYKTFRIPIFRTPKVDSEIKTNNDLRLDKSFLKFLIIVNQEKISYIELFNFADVNLTDLKFISSSKKIEVEKIEVEELGIQESLNISLTFNSKEEGYFKEFLTITYLSNEVRYNITIPIEAFVFPKGTNESDLVEPFETCSDLGGLVCKLTENCNGQARFAEGGDYCCIGTCEEVIIEDSEGNNNLILGLLIFAALALIGYAVYSKVKKTKPMGADEKLKEQDKSYSKRISGGLQRT